MSDELDESETPVVWVHLRIKKKIGSLPPMALKSWLFVKAAIFLLVAAGITWRLVVNDPIEDVVRYVLLLGFAWFLWDRVISRPNFGASHIFVTSRGVIFTEDNLYLEWKDIANYQISGSLLRFRPQAGRGPGSLFGGSTLDIPLTEKNRELVRDLFSENVARWKPA